MVSSLNETNAISNQVIKIKINNILDYFHKLFESEEHSDEIAAKLSSYITQRKLDLDMVINFIQNTTDDIHYTTLLGLFYEHKLKVENNQQFALQCYQRSAGFGDVYAQYLLGQCCFYGIGVAKNLHMTYYWYHQAAKSNNSAAQFELGNLYFDARDYMKAFHLFQQSAINGFYKSYSMLGLLYRFGGGTAKDEFKEFKCYLKSANYGNTIDQINLAICYKDVIGTRKSYHEALKWCKIAYKAGREEEKREITRLLRKLFESYFYF
ncbi:7515_t:CDS:1 [Ambispora gerdemannii]|uniref:7515_t:CDS:1 n=1 Tax=Ambispora gerdemannii TaxID=144530 RepID=A0A9N9CG72_9GLOM|nr:7515_t:CDS:1 [Ambispora gerdemannii]